MCCIYQSKIFVWCVSSSDQWFSILFCIHFHQNPQNKGKYHSVEHGKSNWSRPRYVSKLCYKVLFWKKKAFVGVDKFPWEMELQSNRTISKSHGTWKIVQNSRVTQLAPSDSRMKGESAWLQDRGDFELTEFEIVRFDCMYRVGGDLE